MRESSISERCFYFCFIKHGICRAVCFRDDGCMQRFHFAGGYSCQTMNSYRRNHCEQTPHCPKWQMPRSYHIYNGIDGSQPLVMVGLIFGRKQLQIVTLFFQDGSRLHKIIAESGQAMVRLLTAFAIIHHVGNSPFQFAVLHESTHTSVQYTRHNQILHRWRSAELCRTCQLLVLRNLNDRLCLFIDGQRQAQSRMTSSIRFQ